MINYKDEVRRLMKIEGITEVSCEKLKDAVAREYLYEVLYMDTQSKKINVLSKALHPSKAWRKAYEKLTGKKINE